MIDWLMIATGTAATFMAGIAAGVLLSQWKNNAKARRTPAKRGAAPMLWDVHSVLNAMNKIALVAERGRPADPSLVYLLSDYLLHSALIQREDGWAGRESLENWLRAHVRMVADHRGQAAQPTVTVQMRENVRRIHANQLLRQLLWVLQKAPAIHQIQIDVLATKSEDRMAEVRVQVEGEGAKLGELLEEAGKPSPWRTEAGRATCELRAAFEAAPG